MISAAEAIAGRSSLANINEVSRVFLLSKSRMLGSERMQIASSGSIAPDSQ